MAVYGIGVIDIHNREHYAGYEAGFMEALAPFDGQVLAVDEAPVAVEGDVPKGRIVLLQFPSAEKFDAWYKSDAYEAIKPMRLEASSGTVMRINGFEMP